MGNNGVNLDTIKVIRTCDLLEIFAKQSIIIQLQQWWFRRRLQVVPDVAASVVELVDYGIKAVLVKEEMLKLP